QQLRVIQALLCGPIRSIDLLLDTRAVELAIGKAVNGENITPVLAEPALKLQERGPVAEFARGLVAQTKANRIRLVRADALPYAQRISFKRIECFRPRLAAMNVRAIGQVQAVVQFHWLSGDWASGGHALTYRAQPCSLSQ